MSRLRASLRRARDRSPFPEGSVTIGAWLLVSGVTAYLFLAIAGRVLGDKDYSPLAALWLVAFTAAPGFFQPLEQEIARALAARRARGVGGAPLIRRGAVAGGVLAVTIVALVLVAALLFPIVDSLFDGQQLLLLGLAIMLFGYFAEHLTRGVLAGNDRFGPYGVLMGSEGILRLAACVALAAVGASAAGPYGLAVGVMPFAAVGVALFRQHGLLEPGPPAEWRELTRNLGLLVVGSVLALGLLNAAGVVVKLLAGAHEGAKASWIFAGMLVTRVPLYFFQAIQATLLPQLAGQRGAGEHEAFRTGLRRLVVAVTLIGAVSIIGAATLGPWVVRAFFGSDFRLRARDMTLLALGSSALMLGLTLAQALIALEHHRRAATGWVIGVGAFALGVLVTNDLLLRAELGYLAGAITVAVSMTLLLRSPLVQAVHVDTAPLLAAVRSEPVEP